MRGQFIPDVDRITSCMINMRRDLERYNHPRRLNHRIGKMVLSTINAKPN
jgi:hypothetical protein